MQINSPPTGRNRENTAISLAIRAKYFFFQNCIPMLRNDPSSTSTGKCELLRTPLKVFSIFDRKIFLNFKKTSIKCPLLGSPTVVIKILCNIFFILIIYLLILNIDTLFLSYPKFFWKTSSMSLSIRICQFCRMKCFNLEKVRKIILRYFC